MPRMALITLPRRVGIPSVFSSKVVFPVRGLVSLTGSPPDVVPAGGLPAGGLPASANTKIGKTKNSRIIKGMRYFLSIN